MDIHYVKFRYDFPEKTLQEVSIHDVMGVIYRLISSKDGAEMPVGIIGIEDKNQFGALIKTHMHFHFATKEKPETMRKRFIRTNGGKRDAYSLVVEKDVVDWNRFYRYPLKQLSTSFDVSSYKYGCRVPIPPEFEPIMDIQRQMAYDEWERGTQILTKAAVKRDSRLTIYERIIEQIDDNGILFASVRHVQDYVLDYYKGQVLPPDRNKIMNIVDGICIKTGLISYDEYFRR